MTRKLFPAPNALVFLVGLIVGGFLVDEMHRPDPAAQQLEFDAYRACLASAGRSGCKMTPQDFVRYYELKHALEGAGDLP